MELRSVRTRTESGVLPEGWQAHALGSLLSLQNGVNADKAAYGTGVPFINVLEIITKARLSVASIPGRVALAPRVVDAFAVRDGDVLFNRTSETQEEVGLASIYAGTETVVFGGFVIRGRSKTDLLDPRFASYSLRSPVIRQQVVARGQGAVRANIGQRELSRVQVVLPTRAEQEVIAEALSDADALIESLEQFLAKKRHLKQGAMQELLTGKKRLPGFANGSGYRHTDLGMLPMDWRVTSLSTLLTSGPTNGWSGRSTTTPSGIPTLSLSATTSGCLVLTDETVKYLQGALPRGKDCYLSPGDVLVQRSNTAELVGTTAVYDGPPRTYVYPDLMMRLRFREPTTGRWFWRYANSAAGRSYFQRTAAGSTGTMPKISGALLRRMAIPLPESEEQEAIVKVVDDMDSEIVALEARLTKARQIKQGMMQELLTGRIRLV